MARRPRKNLLVFVVLVLCTGFGMTAKAQLTLPLPPLPRLSAPLWLELDPQTREILLPHHDRWDSYPVSVRLKLLKRSRSVLNIPRQKRLRLEQQLLRFRQLPSPVRRHLCQQFKRQRGFLPPPCRVR
jgi:hypothetical protein